MGGRLSSSSSSLLATSCATESDGNIVELPLASVGEGSSEPGGQLLTELHATFLGSEGRRGRGGRRKCGMWVWGRGSRAEGTVPGTSFSTPGSQDVNTPAAAAAAAAPAVVEGVLWALLS